MHADATTWVEELAHVHGRMVFAVAYRVLGNADDAEDVQQAVFLKLLDRRMQSDAAEDWGAYLRVAATRQAIDVLRQRSRRAEDSSEVLEELPASLDGDSQREAIDARRTAQQLRLALASLPEREARIFTLRYFEELPYEEIARRENASVSHIGVIIHRSRNRLRELLQPLAAVLPPGRI